MFSNWMFQSKEFNTGNSSTSEITLKQHASKQLLEGNNKEPSASSPQGNMHKLFDCIKTPLKHF